MTSCTRVASFAFLTASIMLLSACSGGGEIASTPKPTSPPSNRVDIFISPSTQEFASASAGDELRIRYDAASREYQVSVNGAGWEQLIDDPNQTPQQGYPNQNFTIASTLVGDTTHFMTQVSDKYPDAEYRYRYSNLATWSSPAREASGTVAFGIATPPGSVPTIGSGTYRGEIAGSSTVDTIDWDGNTVSEGGVGGSVSLLFDFAKGALSGELALFVNDKADQVHLAPFAFKDTAFSVGSGNYSGRFVTNADGPNSFAGLFTGPGGEELIGQWTVPFLFKGVPESASGAWIAKRGN